MFTGNGDVHLLFFYFDNLMLRGKDENDKSLQLLAQLHKQAFKLFFQRFTSDGQILDKPTNFEIVQTAFF